AFAPAVHALAALTRDPNLRACIDASGDLHINGARRAATWICELNRALRPVKRFVKRNINRMLNLLAIHTHAKPPMPLAPRLLRAPPPNRVSKKSLISPPKPPPPPGLP